MDMFPVWLSLLLLALVFLVNWALTSIQQRRAA